MGVILDQHGKPLTPNRIHRVGAPAEIFDRTKKRYRDSVAPGLTPATLGHILRQNDAGDNQDLLTLGIEAPERDLDLFSDLQTRGLSIWGAPLRVKPVEDTERGRELAELCQKAVVNQPIWRWLLRDLMDAVLMGYVVIYPIWDTTTTPWSFKEFQFCDQRAFMYDKDTLRELRMRKDGEIQGVSLPPGFVVHYPQIRAGLKLRAGLIRLVAVNHLFKTSDINDFMAFAETFGMPLRIGKFNPATVTDDEQQTLREALVNLGHDAACMLPDSMQIEILDARRPPSGDNVFLGLARYFDAQRTKAILGTAPSAEGSSAGQGASIAQARREVRQDLREADALAVSATCDLIINQWRQVNFGVNTPELHLEIDITPPADSERFTAAILPWVREAGMAVPEQWLRDRLQIPAARKGEKMLEAPLMPGAQPGGDHAGAKLDGAKRGKPSP